MCLGRSRQLEDIYIKGKLDKEGESLRVIRWNDNKIVNIMTTFGSAFTFGNLPTLGQGSQC